MPFRGVSVPGRLHLLFALLLSAAARALAPAPPPPTPPALLMRREALSSPAAVCGDGSRAAVFFRNCSANWDSRSGFDYCANITDTWLVVFGSDDPATLLGLGTGAGAAADAGAFCYSAASCAARAASLKGSAGLPARAFPGGLLSPFAEVNPNLYKAHTVVVPYCSSDLFAGNATATATAASGALAFAGGAIVDAALTQLFSRVPAGEGPTAAHADRFVLVGGAGVMARLDELAELLRALKRAATRNASAALEVFGVCDGCLLVEPAPPLVSPPACTTDADCPPSAALPALHALAPLLRPRWCTDEPAADVWRCYAAPRLAAALAAARTPLLAAQQLFDARQLRSLGVADPFAPTPAERAWAESAFAPTARAALAGAAGAARYAFAAACAAPHALATNASAYYHLQVRFVDPYGNDLNASMGQALPSFLESAAAGGLGPAHFGTYADNCTSYDCGLFCGAVSGRNL